MPLKKCPRCKGSLAPDDGQLKCINCGRIAQSTAERHKFHEEHKAEMLADADKLGAVAMRKKWRIPATSWQQLKARWLAGIRQQSRKGRGEANMKALLDQGAIAVAHATAEEESRPILTCVQIGNGEIVATDGYILVRHPAKTEGEGVILVPGKAIIAARGLCPYGDLLLEQSGDEVVIKSDRPTLPLALTTKVVMGQFPSLDDKYSTSETVVFIALSPGLLKKLLDAVPDASMIKFRIRGPHEPVEFVADETNGLIMPMRVGKIEKDEHWHKVEKAGGGKDR